MGLRFRKSITLCKGVKLNLGMKSASISVGRKGIHQSISTTGRTTTSLSLPGTGLGYTKSVNLKKGFKSLFGRKKEEEMKEEKKTGGSKAAAAPKGLSEAELNENRQIYEEYCRQIALIRGIHKQADDPIDWQEVYGRPEPVGGALSSLRSDTKQSHEEWQELHELSEKVLAGDLDTYLALVDEFRPFDDLLEYGSDFEVGTDDPSFLEVEFHVKSAEVMPEREYILDDNGRLKEKDLSKTAYYDMLQDYVCSAVLRVARDSFALLPIDRVIIHATDTIDDSATGRVTEETILSVSIGRSQLEGMDFSRLDPSDCLGTFPIKMNFKKTKGFSPVERLS